METRLSGKIIKISEKGYGFITSRDLEFTRIFFHWTSLMQGSPKFTDLRIGTQVEFTPTEVPEKGWRAIRIKILGEKND